MKKTARTSTMFSIHKGLKIDAYACNCRYTEEAEVKLALLGSRFEGQYIKTVLNAADPHLCNQYDNEINKQIKKKLKGIYKS